MFALSELSAPFRDVLFLAFPLALGEVGYRTNPLRARACSQGKRDLSIFYVTFSTWKSWENRPPRHHIEDTCFAHCARSPKQPQAVSGGLRRPNTAPGDPQASPSALNLHRPEPGGPKQHPKQHQASPSGPNRPQGDPNSPERLHVAPVEISTRRPQATIIKRSPCELSVFMHECSSERMGVKLRAEVCARALRC